MTTSIKTIVEDRLADLKTAFLSEADFQFSLAWQLQKVMPTANVILEYPCIQESRIVYFDIAIQNQGTWHLIELKYRTRNQDIQRYGHTFPLRNHSAHDLGRESFLLDIERLENRKTKDFTGNCYAIFLTNDPAFWNKPPDRKTNDLEFRIHNGRELQPGEYHWQRSNKIYCQRNSILKLSNSYQCTWKEYSSGFKYLFLEVK